MTPKKEAEELVRKYYTFGINKEGQTLSWDECKQCALIAVDKILEHCYQVMKPFWQEVKQEIEKL